MNTKYNSVLKVKKQQLDKAEMNLSEAKKRENINKEAFEMAQAQYLSLNLPSGGNVQALKQGLEFLNIARATKDRAKEKLFLSRQEIKHYQYLYEKANLDYEKIKYLESEELKKIKKELQKAEEKFIDEIAVSRFVYEGKR